MNVLPCSVCVAGVSRSGCGITRQRVRLILGIGLSYSISTLCGMGLGWDHGAVSVAAKLCFPASYVQKNILAGTRRWTGHYVTRSKLENFGHLAGSSSPVIVTNR